MKRPDDHRPQQGFWDLFTSFILSATVGMVLFNFLRVISMHNASIAPEGGSAGAKVLKRDLALQVRSHHTAGAQRSRLHKSSTSSWIAKGQRHMLAC